MDPLGPGTLEVESHLHQDSRQTGLQYAHGFIFLLLLVWLFTGVNRQVRSVIVKVGSIRPLRFRRDDVVKPNDDALRPKLSTFAFAIMLVCVGLYPRVKFCAKHFTFWKTVVAHGRF